MSKENNSKNSFKWVHHYIKFGFLILIFIIFPFILALVYSGILLLGLFERGITNFLIDQTVSSSARILFWGLIVFVFGGFLVVFILLFSFFNYTIYTNQIRKFFALPINKRVFYKMQFPIGYKYDSRQIRLFMKSLLDSFVSKNISWSSVLRTGKYHFSTCFDYVIENGQYNYYISFPFNKQLSVFESIKRFFPDMQLTRCEDPFATLPDKWNEELFPSKFRYQAIAGSVISHNSSAIYGTTSTNTLQVQSDNINGFVEYLGKSMPQNKFVLQYVYTFDSHIDTSYYDQKYDELATKTLEQFSPSSDKKHFDSDAFGALVPSYEIKKLNDISHRLSNTNKKLVRAGIKVVAFCSTVDLVKTERLLDKAIKSYFQSNSVFQSDNQLQKTYLTATNQTYFNHHKVYMDLDERARFMFDRMIFLPTILEPYFASIYNTFYYPNENRWRRQSLYICFKKRSGYKPWPDSLCLLDFDTIDRFFQIPTITSNYEAKKSPAVQR